jgi:hypothetical protein
MADQGAITVTTSSTQIVAASDGRLQGDKGFIVVHNAHTADVYIGASDVTTSTGIILPAGETQRFVLRPTKALHAILASGTGTIRYGIHATNRPATHQRAHNLRYEHRIKRLHRNAA